MIEHIPIELRTYAQWICWRYESRDDKSTKVPYNPVSGHLAAVDDPTTWTTFEIALAALRTGNYDGLGFVLTEHDPFAFIDLDIKGEIPLAELTRQIRIQEAFDTYSERSPSGRGLHILCKGHVARGRKRSNIEVYSSLRYMTVTGDVYENKPINERQNLLQLLWSEMGVGTPIYSEVDAPQTIDDSEVLSRGGNAANGAKFIALMQGKWRECQYPSQSEADFALIDMVAFYTQNREQIVRLFRSSWLGQRDKAQRIDYINTMVNRSFDRMLPQINFDSLKMHIDEFMTGGWSGHQQINGAVLRNTAPLEAGGENRGEQQQRASPTLGRIPKRDKNVKFPIGLLGEIATFIFQASPRPVAEVALAAAIGLMSGICGRAYNTPTGAGLNMYTLLIALSGIGKEAMSSGIARLTESVAKIQAAPNMSVPSIRDFLGPSHIRSDAALIKQLSKQPSMVSIIGEFGLKLKNMHSQHANAHQSGLKDVFLDLFHKSGSGNVHRPMIYSDKDKNTSMVEAPAFSILAESTPSTFYDVLDETLIEQGLLSRFFIIEYLGLRPPSNHAHMNIQPSPQLQANFGSLAAYCHTIQHSGRTIFVSFADQQTFDLADQFDKYCDKEINATDRTAIRDLWNRGHLKTLKLSSLVGVGVDPYKPLITADVWLWAQELIESDIRRMVKRFEKGEVGGTIDTNEIRQQNEVLKVMREYMFEPWERIEKYKSGTPAMQRARVVPGAYINRRLINTKTFKHERMGATNALNRTIKTLLDNGAIAEATGKAKFDIGGKIYMISDMRFMTETEDE